VRLLGVEHQGQPAGLQGAVEVEVLPQLLGREGKHLPPKGAAAEQVDAGGAQLAGARAEQGEAQPALLDGEPQTGGRMIGCCTKSLWCYTLAMPTTKPRYTVTDSGAVSELLDEAQRRWPEVRDRKALLLLLAEAGRAAIEGEGAARRAAVAETAGALSGVYEPDELARLREDWPA